MHLERQSRKLSGKESTRPTLSSVMTYVATCAPKSTSCLRQREYLEKRERRRERFPLFSRGSHFASCNRRSGDLCPNASLRSTRICLHNTWHPGLAVG